MKSKKIISSIFIVAIAIFGFIFVLKVETKPLPTMKDVMVLPDITEWVEFGSSEKYDPILNEINKKRPETIVSTWKKYTSETLGISFNYPSQYESPVEPMPIDNSELKAYAFNISDVIGVYAVQTGWSEGEPSFMSDISTYSDYLNCEEYKYTTKTGIMGYRFKSQADGNLGDCGVRVQGTIIEGYMVYVFDLKRLSNAKIAFVGSDDNQILMEELLDTLEIIN